MEPGFVPKTHFARYDRRELDTYYRAPWVFGAVPGGNGSLPCFRLMLPKFHLYSHLPSYLHGGVGFFKFANSVIIQ